MGLDITIKRIRYKHFVETDTIEDVYKNTNSKFVAEFRNIWDWVNKFYPTDKEDENGRFYRFVTKSMVKELIEGNETERLKTIVNEFDFDKFIYTVEFDY